jgi:hypothetical protein
MGRGLLSLGSFLLVATVALWIAGAAGWIPETADDQAAALTLRAGLVLVAASFVLRVVTPVTKQMGMGRCSVCGVTIERGGTYCLDHLQQTVNTYRDRNREATLPQPKRRG